MLPALPLTAQNDSKNDNNDLKNLMQKENNF